MRALTALAGILLCTVSVSLAAAQQSKLRIVQTNSAGDNIYIIDPVTNKVVGEIKGIEMAHGIAVAQDNSRIYVSEEADEHARRFRREDPAGHQTNSSEREPQPYRHHP